MKQFVIITNDFLHKVINQNSNDCADYLMSGWSIIFNGNKRECEARMELIGSDGALAD